MEDSSVFQSLYAAKCMLSAVGGVRVNRVAEKSPNEAGEESSRMSEGDGRARICSQTGEVILREPRAFAGLPQEFRKPSAEARRLLGHGFGHGLVVWCF